MEFTTVDILSERKKADLICLPFWTYEKNVLAAFKNDKWERLSKVPVDLNDFKAKEGEVLILYLEGEPEARVALLGLGEKDKLSVETLRRSYGCLTCECRKRRIETLNIQVPVLDQLKPERVVRGVVEGLLLANYSYDALKSDTIKKEPTVLLKKACLIGIKKQELEVAKRAAQICSAVYFSRDLVNGNADDVTPQFLCQTAQSLAKKFKNVKATIFNKKRIEKEKMGLLLAVNRGSDKEPALIIVEYNGNPKSKDRTVVVGKGVTYDTGGLNLKPTGSMETMKSDMGGAAAALGTLYAAASLGLKCNLTAVVPTTENSVSSTSYKPGDVYKSYSGKTVEIGNTDAEGRLILADALAYASKNLKPSRIIDFATLTGSIVIALGEEATGLMSNDDSLAEKLIDAGKEAFERVWRLPLFEEYKKQLKSDIADISNVGGRPAGSITAGIFLQEFVGNVPWAHCDIAGTAYLSKEKRYLPKHATGVGVRLMVEFLEQLNPNK